MRHVTLESLESRRLLAAQIVNGELIATGTGFRDDIELRRTGTDDVRVTIWTNFSSTPSSQQTFDLDDFSSIRALGLAGSDYLHVVGNVTLPNLTLDGGEWEGDVLLARNARFIDGEQIRDGSGRLVVTLINGPVSYNVNGTAGADRISWTSVNGADRVEVNSSFVGTLVRTDFGFSRVVFAGAGNDTVIIGNGIHAGGGDGGVFGEGGNDFFDIAAGGHANVFGGDGADTVLPRGGPTNNAYDNLGSVEVETLRMDAQTFCELEQFDLVFNVTEAQGVVIGNHLDNRVTARSSTTGVTMRGGLGDDTLIGSPAPDQLFGEEGDDILTGNGGNDLLEGGEGIDSLSGGDGDDTLIDGENNGVPQFFIDDFGPGFRNMTVYGTLNADTINAVRTGVDDVRFTVNGVSRTFDMDDFDQIFLYGGPGNDTISAGNGIVLGGDGVSPDVLFFGGRGNDILHGNDLVNQLSGDAGDDTIFGNGAIDAIFGGDGNDNLDGGSGVDLISGEDGDDTITGGPGADGGTGGLIGGGGNDTFFVRDGEVDDVEGGGDPADRAQADPDDNLEGIEQILP